VKIAVSLIATGLLGISLLLLAWPWINVVETGRTPQYPDLVPQRYRAGPERVFDAALHAIQRLSRWTLITARPDTGEIRAEARTLVLRFVDDVHIKVAPADTGAELPESLTGQERTVVGVRSASRVGRADFGQNARNVREFFEELTRQLSKEAVRH
jgi:uncharacterized protein (DUF1499 family)